MNTLTQNRSIEIAAAALQEDEHLSAEVVPTMRRLQRLATSMDSAFRIPGTQMRIGFDSLLGLIPVLGDVATTVASAIIVRQAIRMGARKRVIIKMLSNIGIDMLLGIVPLWGDIFDFAFKANTRNVALLEQELRDGLMIHAQQ